MSERSANMLAGVDRFPLSFRGLGTYPMHVARWIFPASVGVRRDDPFAQIYQKSLIDHLIEDKQYSQAVAAMEHYEQLFPEDDFMRKMLKIAKE